MNFGFTFPGLYVVEKAGRRKGLMWGAAWMFMCFMVFSSVGHFSLDRNDPPSTPGAGAAMVVFACLCKPVSIPSSDVELTDYSHCGLCHDLGTSRLGHRRRTVPYPLPYHLYGHGLHIELDLELSHLILLAVHHIRNRFSIWLHLRSMFFRRNSNHILLPGRTPREVIRGNRQHVPAPRASAQERALDTT